jgi:hypothetical protein
MSPSRSSQKIVNSTGAKSYLNCLVSHVAAQLRGSSFVTVMHVGNSDYLRFLHDLISNLLVNKHRVHVLDFRRSIKLVYLQQALRRASSLEEGRKHLNFQVILNEDHALKEYQRLQRQTPSQRKFPALFLIDPSGLFGRIIGSVKQASSVLQMQYEAAKIFAEQGYAVIFSDVGSRSYHRTESLVPAQLSDASTLILQFLPSHVFIN